MCCYCMLSLCSFKLCVADMMHICEGNFLYCVSAVGFQSRLLVLQLANGSYCPMVVTSNHDAEGQQQMLM